MKDLNKKNLQGKSNIFMENSVRIRFSESIKYYKCFLTITRF